MLFRRIIPVVEQIITAAPDGMVITGFKSFFNSKAYYKKPLPAIKTDRGLSCLSYRLSP
jgi:hypothetical protein